MKKFLLIFGLLATTCLTACGSKNFNMTFDEALEASNHSQLQDILSESDTFEQIFKISGNYNSGSDKIKANISSESKQNTNNNNSESITNFDIDINNKDNWKSKINWVLNIKLTNDTLYLNFWSLDLTWNDNLAMIGMMAEWFKDQWLSLPMTWLSNVPNTMSYIKDSKKLNSKIKDIVNNDWSTIYSWKFSQFNGYNAWKISLNNDKINELIKEYYNTLSTQNTSWENINIPTTNIQEFEGYLVITWKDKVTTIIENMKMVDDNTTINANWFAWENYEINLSENDNSAIQITAKKKFSKYDVSISIANNILLNWAVSPKLSKSWINLDFDATLTIKNENDSKNNINIPFKGSREYKSIQEFAVSIPENSKDLTQLLSTYLWWMMWWIDYTGDIYNDYNNIYNENDQNLSDTEINNEEIWELKSLENNENTTTN